MAELVTNLSISWRTTVRTRYVASVLPVLLGWALMGCGNAERTSDSRPSAQGGAGGATVHSNAGTAGVGAPSAGTGGGAASGGTASVVPADANEIEACRHYLTAACDRLVQCDPYFAPFCEDRLDACPGRLFAEGSLWTVEEVYRCAGEWSNLACDKVVSGFAPSCARDHGTRAVGEGCFAGPQCATGFCSARRYVSDSLCGKCLEAAPSLGTCSSSKPCPVDQYCFQPRGDTTGTCRDRGAVPTTTPVQVDGTCGIDGPRCAEGLVCQIELFEDEDDEPRAGKCVVPPGVGKACAPTFYRMGACAEGATCTRRPTGECVAEPTAGQSCGFTHCDDASYCYLGKDPAKKSHTCYARGEAGSSCERISPLGREPEVCVDGLECMCVDAECKTGKCAQPRLKGESCNGTTEVCLQGFECVSGICQVMKERNLAAACQ